MASSTQAAHTKSGSGKHKTKKSIATRQAIVEATLQCFIELGYHRTTTTEIAKMAGVTRGAVQYYFPTTEDVLRASIEYVQEKWLEIQFGALRNMPPGASQLEWGTDVYWEFTGNKMYEAWRELNAAARTEPELRDIMRDAARKFDRVTSRMGRETYPQFVEISAERLQLGGDFMRAVVDGLVRANFGENEDHRTQAVLQLTKKVIRELWEEDFPD